ncbi:MAG: hypothetical protein ACHQM4_07360 [Thermoanaerobaculia bacterium]
MKRAVSCVSILVVLLVASGWTFPALAQESPRALVATYQVAAGKHLEFLKWMARAEAVVKEAGGPATQWYMHENGGSWDFVSITPQLDAAKQAEVDRKVETLSKQKGISTGLKASFEFRQFIGTHTDTFAHGPMTAGEIVKAAEK